MDIKNHSNFPNTLHKEEDHLFNKDRNKILIVIQDINNLNNLTNLTNNKLTNNSLFNHINNISLINNRILISKTKMIHNFTESPNTLEGLPKELQNNTNICHNKINLMLPMFNSNQIFTQNHISGLYNTHLNSLYNSPIINTNSHINKHINNLTMNKIHKNINKKIQLEMIHINNTLPRDLPHSKILNHPNPDQDKVLPYLHKDIKIKYNSKSRSDFSKEDLHMISRNNKFNNKMFLIVMVNRMQ